MIHDRFIAEQVPTWGWEAVQVLRSRVSEELFPCLFAKKSVADDKQFLHFMPSADEESSLSGMRSAFVEYVRLVQKTPVSERLYRPMIVFVKPEPPEITLERYHEQAWGMLQYLHEHDPEPWPTDTPADPSHYLWSFCFCGEQLFVNMSAPAHRRKRSRNLGSSLTLVVNPRRNFDVVAGRSLKGTKVRETIRGRIAIFDGERHSDHLGTYGDPDNFEWKQYGIDEADQVPSKCPLSIGRGNLEHERKR